MDTDRKRPDYVKKGAELEFRRRNPDTGHWYKMPVEVLTDPVWSDEAGPRKDGDWVVEVQEKYPPETREAKVFKNTWTSRLHEPEYVQTVTPGEELRQRMRTDDGTLLFGRVTAKSGIVDHKVRITYQTRDGVVERTLPRHFLYTIEAAEKMLQRAARSRTPDRGGYSPRRDASPDTRSNADHQASGPSDVAYATKEDMEGIGSDIRILAKFGLIAIGAYTPKTPEERAQLVKHASQIAGVAS